MTKEINYLDIFKQLPNLTFDDDDNVIKADNKDGLAPKLQRSHSRNNIWYVTWGEEAVFFDDVIRLFSGNTPEEAIQEAYDWCLENHLIEEEEKTMCSECAFSVDNCYCGLPGFTSRYPRYKSKGCSAFNKEAPNGYSLQSNGYFGWE